MNDALISLHNDRTPFVTGNTLYNTKEHQETMQYFDSSLSGQVFRDTSATLRHEVDTAEPRLRGLSEAGASEARLAGKWSPKEILGHLIDSAANNHQRFVRIQAEGDLQLPGYAQEFWVNSQRYVDRPWPELIDLWCSYNRHLSHVIACISEDKGGIHCQINGSPVSLRHLALDYVGHLQHHLRQIISSDPSSVG